MAEISTSGDIDLVIVSCDTPFNELRMEDGYGARRLRSGVVLSQASGKSSGLSHSHSPTGSLRKGKTAVGGTKGKGGKSGRVKLGGGLDHAGGVECVVATTGIGLQREILRNRDGLISRDLEMVLKPRVVLEYTLVEALKSKGDTT